MSSFSNFESWVILSPIEQQIKNKIEKIGTPLKDWDIRINYGIKTGFNEAFIIDGVKRKELIDQDPKSEEIIRPILRGRDIKRYGYESADLWILFIPWHFPLHNDPSIKGASEEAEYQFRNSYPAVYKHLSLYKEPLSNRNKAETGIRYEWYALQRWGANYWEDFYRQKIIYPGIMRIAKSNLTNFPRFAFDKSNNFFFGNDCYFIVGQNLEYLWLLLNSTLLGYLYRYYIYSFDETGFKIFTDYFQNIPLPLPDKNKLDEVEKLLSSEPEISVVNSWVYNLIGLNSEEICEIENSVFKIVDNAN